MTNINQFVCQNNPEHIFEKATDDFWCPTCPRELRSSLTLVEVLSKPDEITVVTETIIAEPIANESIANEPIAIEPIINEPIVNEPIVNEPIVHEPIETDPLLKPKVSIIKKPIVIQTCDYGAHTWMKDYLKIKELDGLSFAESPEDWKEAQALKKPVYCFPNDDQELGSSLGLLYNWYAVQLISMNPPKGFRIPNSNDIIDLNQAILQTQEEFLDIDFAFQQKIPIAHRLPLATFADGTNDRCFWTSEQYGYYTAFSYRINLENKIARTRKIDKNAGYFIRCIQNS